MPPAQPGGIHSGGRAGGTRSDDANLLYLEESMPTAARYPYIYVNADGTARELSPNEWRYLESKFHPGDGAAPYVKSSYSKRDGWGDLSGYLERSKLPHGIQIRDLSTEDP